MSISSVREQPTGKSRVMHIYKGGQELGGATCWPQNYLVILFTHLLLVITFTKDMSFGLVGIG